MAKYSIREKKEKKAEYRNLVRAQLMVELRDKMLRIFGLQKKYRDKNFTAKKLAVELGTNTRYVSAVVNCCFGVNYSTFVNGYRIREAKEILADPKSAELTMADVGDMVGFANRQSFYSSFYRETGITPREYRRRTLQGSEKNEE